MNKLFKPWITSQLIQLLVNYLPFVTIAIHDLTCQKMLLAIVVLNLACQEI